MDLDDLIFGSTSTSAEYDRSTWARIAVHLVERLSRALAHDLSLEGRDEEWNLGEGLSVDVRSADSRPARWKFAIRGIVGAQLIKDRLLVRAWIFVYLGNLRMAVEGRGDTLVMRYVQKGRVGEWEAWGDTSDPDGWTFGEPGEFDAFRHFDGT